MSRSRPTPMSTTRPAPPSGTISRRGFIAGAGAGVLGAVAAGAASAQQAAGAAVVPDAPLAETPAATPPFDFADLVALARDRASKDYAAPAMTLRAPFANLEYDQYRAIRFRADARPLAGSGSAFAIDLLPPGSVYRQRVSISIVRQAAVEDLAFSSDLFDFDASHFPFPDGRAPSGAGDGLDFTGFRLRSPINSPDVLDEFLVFQGASYFRGIARNMIFGLSARGLAIATADPRGEEFPHFRNFWIHEPRPDARDILVHALLDSPSVTGAFEFEIRPGETTVMQTRCRLFPRTQIDQIGIAPLTSMYYFGPEQRAGIDDFRDAVHDSAGLQMITGQGTRLWRPLTNPARVEISAFVDENPKGFGLTQRPLDFSHYQDAEARYDRRPSGWVEPLGEWGPGTVMLVEIPVENEFNDNIVAFWRPREPLQPSEAGHEFAYRLHWCATPPDAAPLARVRTTRSGISMHDRTKRDFVIDFALPSESVGMPRGLVTASAGAVSPVTLTPLPGGQMLRAAFVFEPGNAEAAELQLALENEAGQRQSETWLYRWTVTR
ncbi:glucan biosynthesis protein [Limibaculum sp. FT325]|uniref:glucan biosynthesis protein n=1 Tax=Thermohalobaculum sediminis TaxID=2939436 RepID=UPI0020BE7880|nr:glucan biosynthesis protein [Limibaculum sediminis]MCL5778672.1 glucan biosynthesis protein [Limibaculum sediminis]